MFYFQLRRHRRNVHFLGPTRIFGMFHRKLFLPSLFIICVSFANGIQNPVLTKFSQRPRRAFDLVKLEKGLDQSTKEQLAAIADFNRRRSLVDSNASRMEGRESQCKERCNEQLRTGLDMVKAHTAFGSVGVPSVIDQLDLRMFCRLDTVHDQCLRGCGYEVQFNMRDYVCKERFTELVSHLDCYAHASFHMRRQCGAKHCGPSHELDLNSVYGLGQRCRALLCDLTCIQTVLISRCPAPKGARAADFLFDYSRVQVLAWLREVTERSASQVTADATPVSCSRLLCAGGGQRSPVAHCTSHPRTQLHG